MIRYRVCFLWRGNPLLIEFYHLKIQGKKNKPKYLKIINFFVIKIKKRDILKF
ncbi:hypothetical protein BpHYR1_044849 [Brachionus plicatilis]|uniref:Uncharacterized protein n=1 Tax=Brachionus plicatilis TaxID=10195 RepID=A0A3M7RAM6_BRAPC|nr:hypothetical protein BpHYR1_044849 [Brachionus plicatilis]